MADTSVLIELLRGGIEAEKIEKHGRAATCFPVECELYRGTTLSRKTEEGSRQVERLLDRMEHLESGREAAEQFAELKERYSGKDAWDLMIASICLQHGVGILTEDSDLLEIEEIEPRNPLKS